MYVRCLGAGGVQMKRVRAAAYTPAVHDVANFLGQQSEHWRGDVGEEARDEGAEVLVIGCKVNQQLLLPRRRFSRCLRRHPGHHAPYLQHASGGAKARERGAARGARRHALCLSSPALWGYHLTHNTQHTTHNTYGDILPALRFGAGAAVVERKNEVVVGAQAVGAGPPLLPCCPSRYITTPSLGHKAMGRQQ